MRTPSDLGDAESSESNLTEQSELESTPGKKKSEVSEEAIIAKYERCSFCNSKLLFTHDLNLSYLQVIENSRCPGCGVTMRPRKFTLH